MAEYKVPQDVEADDKLIGPFSFRQFIYLIIVSLSCALAWVLGNLFPPLAILPLPVIIFFGALALPLRKDQPMEIYMAAIVSFYLKPRKRLWDPDGIESLIEITAPKDVEYQLTKDLSQNEAQRRFSYLADIVDSQGWAVRGVGVQPPNRAFNDNIYLESQQIEDIQDINSETAQVIKYKLDQSDAKHHQDLTNIMNHKPVENKYYTPIAESKPVEGIPIFNPYPDSIQQSIIQPMSEKNHTQNQSNNETDESTSINEPSADIISLANDKESTIAAIARKANRIHEKQVEEVVIKLR